MKNIITISSKFILTITLFIFAWSVYHVDTGGQKLGILTNYIRNFSSFPQTVADVFRKPDFPESFLREEDNFQSFNHLDYNLFALNASFVSPNWIIRLLNLRNDSTIFQWNLKKENYLYTDRIFSHSEPRSSIILNDKSIILSNDESFNLFRLDKHSKIIWANSEYQFHHGMNLDDKGDIWVIQIYSCLI